MAFTPKPQPRSKPTLGTWKLDSNLPKVKYRVAGRLDLSAMARDIAEKLPVKKFRDRVEFDDIVGQIFVQVWPRWEDYFSPLVREAFGRNVHKAVFEYAKIELADEKNDSRSDTK